MKNTTNSKLSKAVAGMVIAAACTIPTATMAQTAHSPLTIAESQTANGSPVIFASTDDKVFTISIETGAIELQRTEAVSAVAAPIFTPSAGTYSNAQIVILSCATKTAKIYFTTDGTSPTIESTLYRTPVSIASDVTVKAVAIAAGYVRSPVVSASYNIPSLTWPASGSSLGTYSRFNYFPPHVLTDISVPQAADTHLIAPGWPMSPSYRLTSVAGADGVNVTGLCSLGFFNGAQITLQCSQAMPLGRNIVSIMASDSISSVVGVFALDVTN